MKELSFLGRLRKDGALELVDPSEAISKSYLEKSNNSLKGAKILVKNDLFEESISLSYYSMYNCLLSLLFRIGIKSENHSGSIILFKKLLGNQELFDLISFAKEERIDKQYYVTSKDDSLTRKSANKMIKVAQKFVVKMKLILKRLKNEDIENLRSKFKKITSK